MKRIALFLVLLLTLAQGQTWNDCPYGKVNDTYPGDCGRYVDTDGDGICDHSQPHLKTGLLSLRAKKERKRSQWIAWHQSPSASWTGTASGR